LAIYEVSKTPCDIWHNKSLDWEGLTSCNVQQGQNKNFGSKKSHFHFKNRELFLQNIELKKIDSQSRLLLCQISHGVLLTSYIAKFNIDDDRLDALKALLQVFKAMSDE
jgi:hypothetical protein